MSGINDCFKGLSWFPKPQAQPSGPPPVVVTPVPQSPPPNPSPQSKGRVLGIDVSHYEPAVDWVKAKAGGVAKMYTKATEGSLHIDVSLHMHAEAAKKAGVQTGAYHFFHADIPGKTQADLYLSVTKGMNFDLPHCLDWEGSSGDGRVQAKIWLEAIEASTGLTPIIYGGYSHFVELNLDPSFARYPLWLAHYGISEAKLKVPAPWTKLFGWQYTDAEGSPRVQGLGPGYHVDANWFYV